MDSLGNSVPITSVKEKQLPQQISLWTYPNPFNSSCIITAPAGAKIEIYDLRGNVVTSIPTSRDLSPLIRGTETDADYSAEVSGDSASAQGIFIWSPDKSIPSGIYFVKAQTLDGLSAPQKILYLK